MTIPRLPATVLWAFAQIEDLTCTASDAAMDNLGLRGSTAASDGLDWAKALATARPKMFQGISLESGNQAEKSYKRAGLSTRMRVHWLRVVHSLNLCKARASLMG